MKTGDHIIGYVRRNGELICVRCVSAPCPFDRPVHRDSQPHCSEKCDWCGLPVQEVAVTVDAMIPTCFCGSTMTLREGKFGSFYGCDRWSDCEGTAALHPDGSLKSTPADKATKAARIKTHRAFGRMWKSRRLTRDQAYAWMAQKMGLEPDRAHIGYFSEAQCNDLIELLLDELVNEVGS